MKILYLVKEKLSGDLAVSFSDFLAAQTSEGNEVEVVNLWENDDKDYDYYCNSEHYNNNYNQILEKIFEYDKVICV